MLCCFNCFLTERECNWHPEWWLTCSVNRNAVNAPSQRNHGAEESKVYVTVLAKFSFALEVFKRDSCNLKTRVSLEAQNNLTYSRNENNHVTIPSVELVHNLPKQ